MKPFKTSRQPGAAPGKQDYDGEVVRKTSLSPLIWLCIVWLCMFGMLFFVGYLRVEVDPQTVHEVRQLLKATPTDHAARRGALAFSGVTLAITFALSIAGGFWAMSAKKETCEPEYSRFVRSWVVPILIATVVLSVARGDGWWGPFTSELGNVLLDPKSSKTPATPAGLVPILMLLLSCVVPCLLLAGACYLLQPMVERKVNKTSLAYHQELEALNQQVKWLFRRVRELDQMLYIGALALVFGTLQLSAGLSVPIASLPKAADVKLQVDLCKAMSSSPVASGPFFAPPDQAAVTARISAAQLAASAASAASADAAASSAAAAYAALWAPSSVPAAAAAASAASVAASAASAADSAASASARIAARVAGLAASAPEALANYEEQCQAVPWSFSKLEAAESLRELVRSITLSFGLAFSALLAAVYVPAMLVLRGMLEKRQHELPAAAGAGSGAVDPLARIGAVVATLSPVLAGLVANTLAAK